MGLVERGRDNLASAGLGKARLNGQVYTPIALATRLVRGRRWGGICLDPACGDGVFLEAAIREAVRQGRPEAVGRVEGWDLDPDAIAMAKLRLSAVCESLGVAGPGQAGGPVLRHGDALEMEPDRPVSLILGNPPYVEAKRMPDALKARIRAVCPHAGRGGFDLYAAFVERCAGWLSDEGSFALIVPNRILVTRSTVALRRWLLELGEVSVEDLSDAGIFGKEAAVYPVVFGLCRGGEPGYVVRGAGQEHRFSLPILRDRLAGLLPLPPAQPVLQAMLVRILEDPRCPALSTRLRVRWTVSFHRSGLRDQYVSAVQPDAPAARRFLGGGRFSGNREVLPYRIAWAGSWIDYDRERAKRDGNGLPPLELFEAPKVVLTQNARRCRAALDTSGLVLKDTFPLIARSPSAHADDLPWAVLVLNSALFHVLYEALYGGTRKGGRFLHFLGSYLHPFPFPLPPTGARELHDALVLDPSSEVLQARAESMVRSAYGVLDEEAEALAGLELPLA